MTVVGSAIADDGADRGAESVGSSLEVVFQVFPAQISYQPTLFTSVTKMLLFNLLSFYNLIV